MPLGTEVDVGPGHVVLDGIPALYERGTAATPLFGRCLSWPRSPISATAELWLYYVTNNSKVRGHGVGRLRLWTVMILNGDHYATI